MNPGTRVRINSPHSRFHRWEATVETTACDVYGCRNHAVTRMTYDNRYGTHSLRLCPEDEKAYRRTYSGKNHVRYEAIEYAIVSPDREPSPITFLTSELETL